MSGFGGPAAGLEEFPRERAGRRPVADGPQTGLAGGSRARRLI